MLGQNHILVRAYVFVSCQTTIIFHFKCQNSPRTSFTYSMHDKKNLHNTFFVRWPRYKAKKKRTKNKKEKKLPLKYCFSCHPCNVAGERCVMLLLQVYASTNNMSSCFLLAAFNNILAFVGHRERWGWCS